MSSERADLRHGDTAATAPVAALVGGEINDPAKIASRIVFYDGENSNGKVPRWFRTLFYFQYREVVQFFNRKQCVLWLFCQGASNSQSFNSEYHSAVMTKGTRLAEIP